MRIGSTLSMYDKMKWSDMEYLLKKDGMLSNFTNDNNQLKKGDVPWRGTCEKHSKFSEIIFSTFTNKDNIVMDWQCGTNL